MKYITKIFFFVLIFLLQNCGYKDYADSHISTKIIEIKKGFLFEDSPEFQIEILDTINLEVPGNPPLTAIQDIAFSENFFFLLDRIHGLLKFDKYGSFLAKVGERGEGPEEYSIPYAIYLDEKENVVLVADWQKRTVISYDLEGIFVSSSNRLPGYPISFFKENDTLLVVQETINGAKEKPRQVLISSFDSKTLEIKNWGSPLYGYHSNFTNIHPIPRILSRVNDQTLFYMPIIRGDIASHSDRDTIFIKQEGRLTPEYLLHLTGFDNTLQLGIYQVVMSEKNAFLRVVYDNRSYFMVIDLENNRPLAHLSQLFDQEMTDEMIPKPFKGNVFYSLLRDKESVIEKNPQLVFYRLPSVRN